MTDAPAALPAVLADTVIVSARLTGRMTAEVRSLLDRITGVPIVLALQTVAELRFGAINAGWGEKRRNQLDALIAGLDVAPPDDAAPPSGQCCATRPAKLATGWRTRSTTATGGSPPPPSATASPSLPLTESSMASPASTYCSPKWSTAWPTFVPPAPSRSANVLRPGGSRNRSRSPG